MPRLSAFLILSLLVLGLVPTAVSATPTETPTVENLFTHNPNTSCAEDAGLALVYTPAEGSNCGYIYGAPIGEIDRTSDLGVFGNEKVFTSTDTGVLTLDASRQVDGVVRVAARESFCASVVDSTVNGVAPGTVPCVPHAGIGGGVGEIIVDLRLTGTDPTVSWGGDIALGSVQVSGTIIPGQTHIDLAYSFDLPASADRVEVSSLTLGVDTHGWHIGTGYANASGATTLNVPTITLVEE